MKKLYALLLLAGSASFAQATLPLYDGFNYAVNSNLGGQGGWTNLNTGDEVVVAANSLSYPGLLASTGNSVTFGGAGIDPQLSFTSQASGVVYASYLLKVTDISAFTFANGSYHFGVGTATSFASTVWLKPSANPNEYMIGINKRTTVADVVYSPTAVAVNQTVLIVIAFDIAGQTSSMWINPASSTFGNTSAPTATLTASTGANVTTIDKTFLRQGSASDTPTVMIVDEIRVGTTWASVTPQATASLTDNAIAGLKVYPNPVSGNNFYISSDATAVKSVAVYDVLGKQVINTKVENEAAINVSNLNAGVYIVKITEEGKTATRKLVIK